MRRGLKTFLISLLLAVCFQAASFSANYYFRPAVSANWTSITAGGQTAASYSSAGTTLQVTTASHGLQTLDWITITNASNPVFDGTHQVTAVLSSSVFQVDDHGGGSGTLDWVGYVWYSASLSGVIQSTAPGSSDAVTINKAATTCTLVSNVTASSLIVSAGIISLDSYDLSVTGSTSVSSGATVNIGNSTGSGLITSGITFASSSTATMTTASKITNYGNGSFPSSAWVVKPNTGWYIQVGNGSYSQPYSLSPWYRAEVRNCTLSVISGVNYLTGISSVSTIMATGTINVSYGATINIGGVSSSGGIVSVDSGSDFTGLGTMYFYSTTSLMYTSRTTAFSIRGNVGITGVSSLDALTMPSWDFSNATIVINGSSSAGRNRNILSGTLKCAAFTTQSVSSATMILNNSVYSPSIQVNSNITNDPLCTWTKGSGTITLSGGSSTISLASASVESMVVSCTGSKLVATDFSAASLSVNVGTISLSTYSLTVTGSTSVSTGGVIAIGISSGSGLSTSGLTFNNSSSAVLTTQSKITNYGNFTAANTPWNVNNAGIYTQAANGQYLNVNTNGYWSTLRVLEGATLENGPFGNRYTHELSDAIEIYGTFNAAYINSLWGLKSTGSLIIGTNGNITGDGAIPIRSKTPTTITIHRPTPVSFTGSVQYQVMGGLNVASVWMMDWSNASVSLVCNVQGNFVPGSGTLKAKKLEVFTTGSFVAVTIDNSVYNPSYNISGNVSLTTGSGTGSILYKKGTGTWTLSDGAATIDFSGKQIGALVVNASASKSMATAVTFDSFTMLAGTFSPNANTFTTAGDFQIIGGTWQTSTCALLLTGTANQTFTGAGQIFNKLSIDKAAGYVNVTDNFTVNTLSGTGGYLRSNSAGVRRTMYVVNPSRIIWMTIKDMSAGHKNAVNAKNFCTNAGNNLGFVFKDTTK